MVSHHYGTQTVNRGAVLPGMLVKHRESTWTASANKRGRLYLHRGIERTYTTDLLVEVYLNGLGTRSQPVIEPKNLTELSGSQYGAGILTTKFQERAMNAYRAYDVIEERKWAEQTLTEEKQKWVDDRAQEIIDALPKEPSGLFRFSVPMDKSPYEGLRSNAAGEAYNDLISAVAYAQAEYDWDHRTGCPF